MRAPTFRQLSTGQIKPPTSGFGLGSMMMLGASLAGFAYLGHQVRSMNANQAAYLAEGQTYMSPLVQKRLAHTFGWFGYGLMSTSAFVYAMRNSTRHVGGIPLLIGSLGTLYVAHMIDYETALPAKALAYTAFSGLIGMSILPLIQISAASAVADAALATGLSMTALSATAYYAPSEQFLNWGGALSMASAGMLFVSVASMFSPSRGLFNIWLWGGLGLTGAFTLYDTQAILYRAKTMAKYDPLGNSIGIYLNAINFFVRFLMIFQGRKK